MIPTVLIPFPLLHLFTYQFKHAMCFNISEKVKHLRKKKNLWHYSSREPRSTEVVAVRLSDGSTGGLVVSEALSLNLNFSFPL